MLITFLAMSTLIASLMLVAALILFYSAHLLFLLLPLSSFCVIAFSRYASFHLYTSFITARVLFVYYLSIYYLIILFTALLLAQFCSLLLVYHRFAISLASVRPIISRVFMLITSSVLVVWLVLTCLFHACYCPPTPGLLLPLRLSALLGLYFRLAHPCCCNRPLCLICLFTAPSEYRTCCCNCPLRLTRLITAPSEYRSLSDQAHRLCLSLCPLLTSSFNNNNNNSAHS